MSAGPGEVVKTTLADSTQSWDGGVLPHYPVGQPQVTVVRFVVAPPARLAPHIHPLINAGVVLRGCLTVVAGDGRERTFGAGEAIVEMVGEPHYGENRGESEVELVMFYAGAAGIPLSEAR